MKSFARLLLFTAYVLAAACSTIEGWFAQSAPAPAERPLQPSLERIAEGVWVHKSYGDVQPWGRVLSQGLVVDTKSGVLLVDTAWTDEDTEKLLALVEEAAGALPELALFTHAHADKMGGAGALARADIATRAHPLTNEEAPARGLRPAAMTVLSSGDHATLFAYAEGGRDAAGPVEVFYPGPGHTRDNIVVYYAPAKILFGGCLIRPATATDLGNTADGNVASWAASVRAVAARFPDAEIVIPSHGAAGGRALLDHTIALAEAANAR